MNTKELKEHEFCLRCGRRLKNPTAREIGYGAVCYKKMQATIGRKLFGESESVENGRTERIDMGV